MTGCSDALWSDVPMPTQKTGQRLVTALLSWWPIYMCSPDHLKFGGVPRHLIHIQEHLQAIQVQINQILRLSISFMSVSARISSLESVKARCCHLHYGASAPWSIWWLAGTSSTLRLGVERRRQPCTGDVETPSPLWASSLVESGIKVTVIVFTGET